MRKYLICVLVAALFFGNGYGQLFTTRTGFIGFYSKTNLEDIKAENNQVYAVIDVAKKNIAFTLLMKGFIFRKELMQEHFNENYVESDKYPKANFSGKFSGEINLDKEDIYKVMVSGNLTLHNITREIHTAATLEIKGKSIIGIAEFKLKPQDFNITIPSIVKDKITDEITVKVKVNTTSIK